LMFSQLLKNVRVCCFIHPDTQDFSCQINSFVVDVWKQPTAASGSVHLQ